MESTESKQTRTYPRLLRLVWTLTGRDLGSAANMHAPRNVDLLRADVARIWSRRRTEVA